MNPDQLKKVHGMVVFPVPEGNGTNLVEHTVRHFFSAQEAWERCQPIGLPTPASFLEQARALRSPLPVISRAEGDDSAAAVRAWASPPLAAVAERAHDEGYYPRYTLLVERAGNPHRTGTAWLPAQQNRVRAEYAGYVVVADVRDRERIRVMTAYKTALLATPGKPWTHNPFRDRLRDCQVAARGPSRAAGDSR